MPTQPSLPGLDETTPPFSPDDVVTERGELQGYTLLLATVPEPEDASRIHDVATGLRSRHGLTGSQILLRRSGLTAIGSDTGPQQFC